MNFLLEDKTEYLFSVVFYYPVRPAGQTQRGKHQVEPFNVVVVTSPFVETNDL